MRHPYRVLGTVGKFFAKKGAWTLFCCVWTYRMNFKVIMRQKIELNYLLIYEKS